MKKLLLLMILLGCTFLVGRFFDRIKKEVFRIMKEIGKLGLKPNIALISAVAIIFLVLGVLIGKGGSCARGVTSFVPRAAGLISANKELILCDFESEKDLAKWKTKSARIEWSPEHASQGKHSGKMTFFGGVQCTNVIMDDYLEGSRSISNWSGFDQLKFDVYNPSSDSQRLILKIKDSNEKAWQRNYYLEPNGNTEVRIYIDELKGSLDPSRIQQFNFFRWEPANEAVLYLDNVRLLPAGFNEDSGAKAVGSDALGIATASAATATSFKTDSSGFATAVESSMQKVFLEPDKFKGRASDTVEISLARNEYESAQLVLYSNETLEDVTIEKSDLTANIGGNEVRIDKNSVKCYVVGYVNTRKPGYDVSYVGFWPDPLEEKPSFKIQENRLQPIWIEVYAAKNIPSGEYSGTIKIKAGDSKTKDIKLKVTVWGFALPKETHLKTAFDFYDGRLMKMYPQKGGESQAEYTRRVSDLKMKYYFDMIKHRIMPVFNFKMKDAFFVEDIKPYLDAGLSAFAIGKYGGSSDNNWPKDAAGLDALVEEYRDYASILRAGKILDKAYIYTYDEPKYGDPRVDDVTKMIHKADPGLRNMVCLHELSNPDKYPGWGSDIDIWCVRNVVFSERIAKMYMDKGKDVWVYVSGPSPPYPTLVIDYPALAYRIVPWQCWKYGIKGYLFWCVNFWEGNPWQNPMNTKWEQNGNGFLYYPGEDGPVTSIRLEVTRDGLEDYEYLYLLTEKIKEAKARNVRKDTIDGAERLLNIDRSIAESMGDYTRDPAVIEARRRDIAAAIMTLDDAPAEDKGEMVVSDFSTPMSPVSGQRFGDKGQLTFELYRNGTFQIDGKSGLAWQRSPSYRDSAIIRSTDPLPKTYKISAVVGDIDYGLSNIDGLGPDPEYKEGPADENGCYLLTVTDEAPVGHHTNDWWHKHRKVCIDVDNNVWGTGMPDPIFMVYFDSVNNLVSLNGETNQWEYSWKKAVTYEPGSWYKVEIEKTPASYITRIFNAKGELLKAGTIDLARVWNENGEYPDYLVLGDPHENYYQGSMKIRSISIAPGEESHVQ